MTKARQLFYWMYPIACFLVFAYPFWRVTGWVTNGHLPQVWLVLLVWAIGIIAMWVSFRGPNQIIRYLTVHWMGASFIMMTVTVLAEFPALIWSQYHTTIGWTVIGITTLLVFLAIVASHRLGIKQVLIRSEKLHQHHRIVQISDVHIGSRQGGFMRRIVDKINTLEADSIVITGDLVDTSAVGMEELSSLANLKAPVYFVIGNHERYADLDKVLDVMAKLNVRTLRQASHSMGKVQFIGIDDADRRDQVAQQLPKTQWQEGMFNVLLYHRPVGWGAAGQAGMDLMLSGHTHNGQIWPFKYLVKKQFDRVAGLYQRDGVSLYVSSGTGTWGPLMRLGTANEITQIDLHPPE